MNRGVKFIYLIILVVLIVGVYRYYQYIIQKNFLITVNTVCSSIEEDCFYATSTDVNFGQNPYKKVIILKNVSPKCLEEHDCDSFSCANISNDPHICSTTYCSDETKTDGENCLNQNNK
jgi:hypothetical protein